MNEKIVSSTQSSKKMLDSTYDNSDVVIIIDCLLQQYSNQNRFGERERENVVIVVVTKIIMGFRCNNNEQSTGTIERGGTTRKNVVVR